jgi:DNA-binding NarL/FixJ family response regulator
MAGIVTDNKQLRILIVDDQPSVRRAVRTLLESQNGWAVCGEAGDGIEAIAKTEELNPDIVVMDMSMPNLNGLEAARAIHKEFPKSHVLILTLHDLPELATLVERAGAQGLVLKSDSNRILISAIEHLGREKTFFAYKN